MHYPVLVNRGKPSDARLPENAHEEENQGTPPGAAKRPQNCRGRQKGAPRRTPAAASRPSAARRRPKRRFGGCGPSWRGRRRRSRSCRPPPIPTSCWISRTGAASSANSHRAIAYIKRYRASGALIVLDVDRLKPINDAFGHAAGDQVLKAIVATLLQPGALLRRGRPARRRRVRAAAVESQRDRREGQGGGAGGDDRPADLRFRGRTITAGASAGVAMLGPHAEAGRALEEADSAMYVRKAQRRHEI